jgi:hypothetical protein
LYDKPIIYAYYYDDFGAFGGTNKSNVSYRQNSYYTSGELCSEYVSGGVLTYTGNNLPEGCSLSPTGDVTYNDLSTTIRNEVDVKDNLTVYVTLNGKTSDEFTCTSCKQEGNYVEGITSQQGILNYPPVPASGGTSTPTVTDPTIIYTFTSQDTSTVIPESIFGTLSISSS